MQISQHVTQLFCPVNYIILTLSTRCFNSLVQRISLDIVHYYQKRIYSVNNIYDARQMRMTQSFQHIYLCYQTLLHNFIIMNAVFSYFLYGPLFICSFITSKINNAHSALTNLLQDTIFSINKRSNL